MNPVARLILGRYTWHANTLPPDAYSGSGKIESLFGSEIWNEIYGKTVIDFGCGVGREALELSRRGAARVIGVETLPASLESARQNLSRAALGNCEFSSETDTQADIIFSIDSFEHFSDPAGILCAMAAMLKPGGRVFVSFGPPWYHPKGLHMPLFPWAHIVFSERSIMEWRARSKTDGAVRYCEVAGGLNQMSIAKFQRLVNASPLRFQRMKTIPIRAFRRLHCRVTREFFTSVVQAVLIQRDARLR